MAELSFAWDPAKGRENLRKHGVAFQEAITVFADERGLLLDDPDHSESEDRFILLGISSSLRALVVVHIYLEAEGQIRIVSARKATKTEERTYAERWKP